MKRLLIILFFLFLMNLAYAQEATLNVFRETYTSKETLQAELNINVDPVNQITASNFILSNEDNEVIPISLFLEKLSQNKYFAYFNLPELLPGVYTFEVRDIRYVEDAVLKQASVKRTFNILNETLNNTSISINPGVILRNQKLEIINNLHPVNITIEAPSYTNLSKTILLSDKLSLNILLNEEDYDIKIIYNNKQYKIPVINLNKEIVNQTVIPFENETNLGLIPPEDSIVFLNSTFGKIFPQEINIDRTTTIYNPIYIKNNWNFSLSNITFTINGNLKEILILDKYQIFLIQGGETRKQIIIINPYKNPDKNDYFGSITVTSSKGTVKTLNLNINFLEEQNNITKNITIEDKVNKTENKTQPVIMPKQKKANTFVIVFIILFLLAVFIYWLFKRKIKKQESFEEHFYKSRR